MFSRNTAGAISPMEAAGTAVALLIVLTLGCVLVFRLITAEPSATLVSGALAVVILTVVVAKLPTLRRLVADKAGIRAEFSDRVRGLQSQADELVRLSMSDEVYMQLSLIADMKITEGKMGESFRRELGYLDVLGYIKFPRGGLAALRDGETYDLTKLAYVTDLGRRYIQLREESARREASSARRERG